jgi:hypothetical protein
MEKCLQWKCNVRVTEISQDRVAYINEKQQEEILINDSVIYATGMIANNELSERFRNLAPLFFSVGDCNFPRLVKHATYEGFCAAMDIL